MGGDALTFRRVFHYFILIAFFGLFLLIGFGGGYALGIAGYRRQDLSL